MKSNQFLTEAQRDPSYALFESLRQGTDRRTRADLTRMHENFVVPYNKYLLSINQMLVERELTADEINRLFTGAAQGAQQSGTNSTMIGRLLPDAIKKKFEAELPAPDAGPVEGFEQKAAQAAQQIQDPEAKQTAMQMIQTAMKNPVAQRLVMAALGGAVAPMVGKVGMAIGGPLGAAAAGGIAGGLLAVAMAKMQGQSWKDAGVSGLKGAAVGAAAGALGNIAGTAISQLGDKMFGGGDAAGVAAGGDVQAGLEQDQAMQDRITNKFPPGEGYTYSAQGKSLVISDASGNPVFTGDIQPKTMDMQTFADLANQGKTVQPQTFQGGPDISGPGTTTNTSLLIANQPYVPGQPLSDQQMGAISMAHAMGNDVNRMYPADVVQAYTTQGGQLPDTSSGAYKASVLRAPDGGTASNVFENRQRYIDRDHTIRMWYLHESVGKRRGGVQLTQEGIGDVLKGATDWLKTKAGNLTQKVTPDKIQQAYKKAGSPTDSDKVYQVLKDAGVDPAITDKLYADMGIPMPGAGGEQAADPNAAAAGAAPTTATDPNAAAGTPAQPGAPAADPASGAAAGKKRLGYNDGKAAVDQMISTLKKVRSEYRAKIVADATAKLGALNKAPAEAPVTQPAAQPTAPVTGTPGVQKAVAAPAIATAEPAPAETPATAGQFGELRRKFDAIRKRHAELGIHSPEPDETPATAEPAPAETPATAGQFGELDWNRRKRHAALAAAKTPATPAPAAQPQPTTVAAESRKHRAADRLTRDFSRFVDRMI